MKITTITVTRGATINVGNYNNVRFEVSATATVDDGEEAETVYARLRDSVTSKVQVEAAKHGAR